MTTRMTEEFMASSAYLSSVLEKHYKDDVVNRITASPEYCSQIAKDFASLPSSPEMYYKLDTAPNWVIYFPATGILLIAFSLLRVYGILPSSSLIDTIFIGSCFVFPLFLLLLPVPFLLMYSTKLRARVRECRCLKCGYPGDSRVVSSARVVARCPECNELYISSDAMLRWEAPATTK